jgi:Na+/H+ antiporter NhaD/arsenite permease-like protein
LATTLGAAPARAADHDAIKAAARHLGETLPVWSVIPFVAILLSIAILPLVAGAWWRRLRNQGVLAILCALPVAAWLLKTLPGELLLVGAEYLSFIALLGSLFVISGGIRLTGDLRATPSVNLAFLLVGAVLANLIGTTGASMLLIRPLLATNSERRRTTHVTVFFIFLVSNIGGCLTPIGDPPLFLGFLEGVPFAWSLRLFPEWLFMVGTVGSVFYLLDRWMVRHETRAALRLDRTRVTPLRLQGAKNFLFLAGVILAVLFVHQEMARVALLVILALASYFTTPRSIHRGNHFHFHPISEVAILFAGIFVTMVPALLILEARGASFGIREPWQFFWLTGGLSSLLDNAPTYLTFTRLALAVEGIVPSAAKPLAGLVDHPSGEALLRAISLGAVFMGAITYIGNGPNFMVKSIAESRGTKVPGFFGYMLWSTVVLIPLLVLVTVIFIL